MSNKLLKHLNWLIPCRQDTLPSLPFFSEMKTDMKKKMEGSVFICMVSTGLVQKWGIYFVRTLLWPKVHWCSSALICLNSWEQMDCMAGFVLCGSSLLFGLEHTSGDQNQGVWHQLTRCLGHHTIVAWCWIQAWSLIKEATEALQVSGLT